MQQTQQPAMEHHDWQSQEYVDHWISSDATHDDERRPILRRVANLIPSTPDAPICVLDIGAGYGVFSQQVLEAFPQAVVVCMDYSEPMFVHARARLAWAGARTSFVKADLYDPEWAAGLPGPFDAVVSSLCIHNLRDPQRIKAVYREVFPLVRPGGAFFNCDMVRTPGPAIAEAYRRDQGPREGEQRGGGRSNRPVTDEGAEPATLENQLRWLREAGFDEVDCFWKDRMNVSLVAFRH